MDLLQKWFDSPMYESLYAHRDDREARQLSRLIMDRFPPSAFPNVLDLACGRGRHSLNLARLGYRVTGVDLSPRAISIATERALSEELSAEFLIRDMCHPLPDRFDGIVNLFTSFGYSESEEENRSALLSMRQMLRPGGFLVIDYLNAGWVRDSLIPRESGYLPTCEYLIERWIDEPMVKKRIRIRRADGSGDEFLEQVALYDSGWFTRELEALGFRIQERLGDVDGSAFDALRSPRLITIASL